VRTMDSNSGWRPGKLEKNPLALKLAYIQYKKHFALDYKVSPVYLERAWLMAK
jgi:hypothetical protein